MLMRATCLVLTVSLGVGLGRMRCPILICRQMVSGCFPLDPFYEARPEAERIRTVRVTSRSS